MSSAANALADVRRARERFLSAGRLDEDTRGPTSWTRGVDRGPWASPRTTSTCHLSGTQLPIHR